MWVRASSGRLVKRSDTTMAGGFDPEAFKAQLKDVLVIENRAMMREMMGEMAKMMRDLKPEQPIDPIDLDAEIPIRERADDEVTVLVDPERQRNVNQLENVEQSEWAKNMTKTMAQMQSLMKEKGLDASMDYSDLSLDGKDDLLPPKFKFPNMKKYSGTDDPHMYLKQYTTYMKSTGLTKAQIV